MRSVDFDLGKCSLLSKKDRTIANCSTFLSIKTSIHSAAYLKFVTTTKVQELIYFQFLLFVCYDLCYVQGGLLTLCKLLFTSQNMIVNTV